MRLIETDSLSNQNIASALSIGSYTATAVRGVIVRVLVNQVAGNGDYIIYATLTKSTVEYQMVPITTAPVASGRTAVGFVSLAIPVDVDDVLQVYIDGLAGDTTTPDTRVDFYEQDYLRPTVTGRTLDVASTGEAGLDFANINAASAPTTLTNITVPTVTTLTNMPAAPSAADNATAAAAAILVTPANKLATGASGVAIANVTQLDSDPVPLDNLVLALGNADGIVAHPQGIADALKLAPTTGAPAAGSVNKHLDDMLAYGGGSGTGTYTDTIIVGATPLDGVRVQLSTDALGTNRVYETYTNALGVFTMNPDPGTYYRWLDLAGYDFAQGVAVVVT